MTTNEEATRKRRLTGFLFIAGAILVNVPYTLLIVNFDYPDILRQPAGEILTRFQAGGEALIWTWLSFAWVGLPILFAILLLHRVLRAANAPYALPATAAGVIGALAQMIGLLRWSFVVPILAAVYTEPVADAAGKEAAVVVFRAIHQYGGVVLGEHIGQSFTIMWMFLVSIAMLRSPLFRRWVAWFGLVAAAVYALAQLELLATVIPAIPVVGPAGLVGSLLWLTWMIVVGLSLVRGKQSGPLTIVSKPHLIEG